MFQSNLWLQNVPNEKYFISKILQENNFKKFQKLKLIELNFFNFYYLIGWRIFPVPGKRFLENISSGTSLVITL